MPRLPATAAVASVSWTRSGHRAAQHLEEKDARRRFAELLRRAFPGCRSENELCDVASVVLEVSPSTVRNWLRCSNNAPFLAVLKLKAIVGFEVVLSVLFDGEGGR